MDQASLEQSWGTFSDKVGDGHRSVTGLSQSKASLVSIKADEIYKSFDILFQFKVNNHVKWVVLLIGD